MLFRILALCSLLMFVAACGQKGPLRLPDDSPIDSIEAWMKFALVLD